MALTLAEANRIVQAALTKAQEMNIKVSVAVCDAGGRLMAFNRMDGAIWGSIYGSQGKAIASNAAAARSTSASSSRRPTICNPTGRPLAVQPAGTETAGWPL